MSATINNFEELTVEQMHLVGGGLGFPPGGVKYSKKDKPGAAFTNLVRVTPIGAITTFFEIWNGAKANKKKKR